MPVPARDVLPLDKERIMGLETEYMVLPGDVANMEVNEQSLRSNLPKNIGSINKFLSNGARFYVDLNSHPEYATPECTSGHSVAIASAAGEIILGQTFGKAFSKSESYDVKNARIFKRTLDTGGHAAGDHENYYIRRGMSPKEVAAPLVPHLLSRIIFSGPGMVTNGGEFSIDQRTWNMDDEYFGAGSTQNLRPFILSREEPHSKTGYRVQVISGSANMMGQAIQFRFDSTSLALRLIEHGALPNWLRISRPARAMAQLAVEDFVDGLTFKKRVTLDNGRQLTAPQLQHEYASRAKKLAEAGYLTDYEAAFAHKWEEMCVDAMEGKISKWQYEVEWLTKLLLLDHYQNGRTNVTLERLQEIDLCFHEVRLGPRPTMQVKLSNIGKVHPVSSTAEIRDAIIKAPDDTRARARGRRIKELVSGKISTPSPSVMDWSTWPVDKNQSPEEIERQTWLQRTPYCTEEDFEEKKSA